MKKQSESERIRWLLVDLCQGMGFSSATREYERLATFAQAGPEALADEVMRAEGIEPEYDGDLRRQVHEFVKEHFARWEELNERWTCS